MKTHLSFHSISLPFTPFHSLIIVALFSLQFSITSAQQPDAVYKTILHEWTLNADGTSDYHYRHEVQILRNSALTAYADKGETFVVYNPDLEELTINEVYTRRLDGSRVEMPQNAFVYQLPSECADCGRFNHFRELAMVHTGMELGCIIVVDYTIHRSYNLLHETLPLQRECPVENFEVVVNYPTEMEVNYDILGNQYRPGGITRRESAPQGDASKPRKLHFSFTNMPQAPSEPSMPADIIPTLRIYNALPEHTPAFTNESFGGAEMAVSSLLNSNDPRKNVTTVRDFFVDNIHLNDIHPSHLGYRHATPAEVWKTGCGTAIDKAVLLAATLNQLNYRARVIGENNDMVGVMIDTVEYRLSVRSKAPIEINGKAIDEVTKVDLTDTQEPTLDSVAEGFYSLLVSADGDDIGFMLPTLTNERTTPFVAPACDINCDITYLLPKGVVMVGNAISEKKAVEGIGSIEISVSQKGNKLRVVRRLAIEKSLIPVDEYSDFRSIAVLWQSFENKRILLKKK